MNDPLLNLIFDLNKRANAALDRAEENLRFAKNTLAEMGNALPAERQPEFDDDGFELPHLDPEDDPATRAAMEAEEAKHPTPPFNLDEVPF